MVGLEPAFGGQPRLAFAQRLGAGREILRDLAEADRRAAVAVAAHDLAVDDVERVGRAPASVRRRLRAPSRAPSAPRYASPTPSSPWRARHARRCRTRCGRSGRGSRAAPVIDAEHVGGDLRHHGLEALADRGAAGDDLDRARGVDLEIFTPSVGPSPLFSTNMATPTPTSSPAASALLHVGVELVPIDLGRTACRAAR